MHRPDSRRAPIGNGLAAILLFLLGALTGLVSGPVSAQGGGVLAIKFPGTSVESPPGMRPEELDWIAARLGASVRVLGHARDGAVRLQIDGAPDPARDAELLRRARSLPGVLYADMTKSSALGFDRAPGAKSAALSRAAVEPSTARIIVRLKAPAVAEKRGFERTEALRPSLEAAGGQALRIVRSIDADTVLVALDMALPESQAHALAERLARVPQVAFAEADARVFQALTATDSMFPGQWNLVGTNGIGIQAAWDVTTGNPGVVVAVVDSGRLLHTDLVNRYANGIGFVTIDTNTGERSIDPRDPGGYGGSCLPGESPTTPWHGTRVAGIIGAIANNGESIAGINWASKVLPVRAIGPCGGYQSDVADAIKWAAGLPILGAFDNTTPAKVINVSLGGGASTCPSVYQDAINAALARGAVVVVAAGNGGTDAASFTPANCSGVITVGATDINGVLAPYSNRGTSVDLEAPGGYCTGGCAGLGIRSTSALGTATPGAYVFADDIGTSYAAPHVAGVASLLLSVKSLAPFQVQALLEDTSIATPSCSGCAHGRVNAAAALAAVASVAPSQVGSLDSQFGSGGSLVLPIPAGFDTAVTPVANPVVGAGGNLIVAYAVRRNSDGFQQVALARLRPDGAFDSTFGPSNGLRLHDLSQLCWGASANSHPEALLALANGQILLSADTAPRNGHCVARFNANGTLDGTFGTAGVAKATYAGDAYTAPGGSNLAVQADGSIYALRRACVGGNLQLARFSSGGAADMSWGASGLLALAIPAVDCGSSAGIEMTLQSDGSFHLTGHYGGDVENFAGVWVRRYVPGGAIDAAFGDGGRFSFAAATARSGSFFKSHFTAVHASGIYLLLATANGPTSAGTATTANPLATAATTIRVTAAGALDASFGTGGWRVLDLADPRPDANGSFHIAVGLLPQADGMVLAVGSKQAFRLAANGALDGTFGMAGRIVLDFGSFSNTAHAFSTSPGRTLVIGTLNPTGNVLRAYVARFITGDQLASSGCYVDPTTGSCSSTGSLGLGSRAVGSEGASSGAVTFTNSGSAQLTITRVLDGGLLKLPVVSDNVPGEFTWYNDDCPAILAAGTSCTVHIHFTPLGPGLRTGSLFINTDSVQGNFRIPLVGTGVSSFTLNVFASGSGVGQVASAPSGIDCGGDCAEAYSAGAIVTLTATPAAGSTFAGWSGGGCAGTSTCTLTMNGDKSVTADFALTTIGTGSAPVLQASVYFGTAADESLRGVSIAAGGLFVAGLQVTGGGREGLVARYGLPLNPGAVPSWSAAWPVLPEADELLAVAATASGVYAAGSSFHRTSDTVGGKEAKAIAVKFPIAGPPGGGFAGATWDRQIPAPPGAFLYGGTEQAAAIVTAVELTQTYAYVVGWGQANFFNACRFFISKLDSLGAVLWTRTDIDEMYSIQCSKGSAAAVLNGSIYAGGLNVDDGYGRPMLRKYAANGTLVWARKPIDVIGEYLGMAAFGSAIYAVGYASTPTAQTDFLVEKWDENGNRIWSRTFDRSSSEDILRAVVGVGSSIYAAGYTRGATAGGSDAIVLEIDPLTGNVLTSALYGGAQDDFATAITTDGTDLYVVGETYSFGSGGADGMVLRFARGGADTTPQPFTFVDVYGVAPGAVTTSNPITVAGINAPAPISVAGGTYSVDGGAFVGAPGTVTNGQVVRVRHTSASGAGLSTDTTLAIGGISDTFTSTTATAGDTTPDPFAFAPQSGVATGVLATSNSVTVSGINAPAPIGVTGGAYSIDGGPFTSVAGTVSNGQSVRVRHTSAGTNSTSTSTTLIIGGVSAAFTSVTADAVGAGSLALQSVHYFGSANDESGLGVALAGGALFMGGLQISATGDYEAMVGRYNLPLAAGAAPAWLATWPALAGGDQFVAVTGGADGFYAAGQSYQRTTDTTGFKENKGIVVKFPFTGLTGVGYDGSIWDQQAPAAPGAFAYGGAEELRGITSAVEGGQEFVYAVGYGQASFANYCRFFLVKLNALGTVLWTRTDEAEMVSGGCTAGNAVTTLNGHVYGAGGSREDANLRPMLRKYDTAGNLVWVRKTQNLVGNFLAVTAFGNAIYAVGMTGDGESPDNDFLLEKWDETGTRVWSRTFDRNGTHDSLWGVVGAGNAIFAVGTTRGATNGGLDAIILEIDPANGNLLKSTLHGGALDERARGVASDGCSLYVVGDAFAPGLSGSEGMLLRYTLLPGCAVLPQALDFGAQSMGTTSQARSVTFTNTSPSSITVSSVTASDAQFPQANDCTILSPGASCAIQVRFKPAIAAGALHATVAVTGTLSIVSTAPGAPATVALAGVAEKSLVTHYYRSILRRAPDAPGKAFWQGEATRMVGLGGNVNETWYAMAAFFYSSAEYTAFNRNPTEFVTDLYNTFFNRAPDGSGLPFWTGEITLGLPREVVLVSFMFSAEFVGFTQSIFGNTAARAEVDTVFDFYRGMLARLPDGGGYQFWIPQFRAAQCSATPAAAVTAQVEAISANFGNGSEYVGRNRTNSQYVGDLYNAFLRRGGDRPGVQTWTNNLDSGTLTREAVRKEFIKSTEFQARKNNIVAQGCLP